MKRSIFALAVVGLALVSCKKDYSCTCNESGVNYYDLNGDGSDEAYPFAYTHNIKIEEANKTQAIAACNEATIKQQDGLDSYEVSCDLTK
jgi:hypothetical protein